MRLSPIVAGLWRLPEWQFNSAKLVHWIEQVLELGVTSFDHADIYGGYTVESEFGKALAMSPGLRHKLQIVTKCGIKLISPLRPNHKIKSYDSSRAHIISSVDSSLAAFQTDYIDLLLIHRPDLLMNPDELSDTFQSLHSAGKVLQFGVSNHSAAQFSMLHRRHPLMTHQLELSPLNTKALFDGSLEQCVDLKISPMIWSPLAGGQIFNGQDEKTKIIRDEFQELSKNYNLSISTLIYAWILRHPSKPLPITGSHRIEAMKEAVAAIEVKISSEDWYRILQASTGSPVA